MSIKSKWDGEEITLTTEFVSAIKNLMKAEIRMMRKYHSSSKECWYCGGAEIKDLATASGISFCFGGKDDKDWIKKDSDIFLTVPF